MILIFSYQRSLATLTTSSSFCFWSAAEILLPTMEEEKPHCGLNPKRSMGTKREASVIRWFSSTADSSFGCLVVIRPNTTNLSSGTSFSASNEPERLSSYSSKSRWA